MSVNQSVFSEWQASGGAKEIGDLMASSRIPSADEGMSQGGPMTGELLFGCIASADEGMTQGGPMTGELLFGCIASED